jgi:phosphoglycerate dehydrogenase-like enzyme
VDYVTTFLASPRAKLSMLSMSRPLLVNTARGGLVNEADLATALRRR